MSDDHDPPPTPDESDWGSRNHVRTLVLMAATVGGIHLCFRLALPFLGALAWALALAMVPVPGTFVVRVPAALFLAMEGDWGKAVILAVLGGAVVGTIDNLLYPLLVGKRLRLHPVLAFISAIGGLVVIGPAGLILGPVVLTFTIGFLEVWCGQPAAGESSGVDPVALPCFENEGDPQGPVAVRSRILV